jgi:predicted GTPase
VSDIALSARVAERCDELLEQLGSGPAFDRVRSVRAGLDDALRLAVAGRMKAGKSTHVNALLGRRVAQTDVGECTRVVTVFRFGFPEEVVIRQRNGAVQTRSLTIDGEIPDDLDVAVESTSSLSVALSNAALRDLVLVDTPGLGSTTELASAATKQFLAIDGASRTAVGQADALMFVVSRAARADDREALAAFRELSGASGVSAANSFAVLARADELLEPSLEPAVLARGPVPALTALADEHASALGDLVETVLPVVGLWAETARSGALSEADATSIAALAKVADRERLVASTKSFLAADVAVGADDRRRLVRALGLRGVQTMLVLADAGCAGATALSAELLRLSGIEAVERTLDGFRERSDVLKAQWALGQLEHAGGGLAASDLRDAAEDLRLEPSMQRLADLSALQMTTHGVELPDELAAEVRRMALGKDPSVRLGLQPSTPSQALLDAAEAGASRWLRYANDRPRTGPDQERVARLMYRSYTHLRMQLSGSWVS